MGLFLGTRGPHQRAPGNLLVDNSASAAGPRWGPMRCHAAAMAPGPGLVEIPDSQDRRSHCTGRAEGKRVGCPGARLWRCQVGHTVGAHKVPRDLEASPWASVTGGFVQQILLVPGATLYLKSISGKPASTPIVRIRGPRIWSVCEAAESRSWAGSTTHVWVLGLTGPLPAFESGHCPLSLEAWLSAHAAHDAHFPTCLAGGFWMQWSISHVCRGCRREEWLPMCPEFVVTHLNAWSRSPQRFCSHRKASQDRDVSWWLHAGLWLRPCGWPWGPSWPQYTRAATLTHWATSRKVPHPHTRTYGRLFYPKADYIHQRIDIYICVCVCAWYILQYIQCLYNIYHFTKKWVGRNVQI